MRVLLLALLVVGIEDLGLGQTFAPYHAEVKLTGMVLSIEPLCDKRQEQEDAWWCKGPNWALASGHTTFLLFDYKATLQGFEHKRVIVSGLLEIEPVTRDGWKMIRRKIAVHSIENSELDESTIEEMVGRLKVSPWSGQPAQECNRGCWGNFAFTDAMVEIMQAGRGAQGILLQHLSDQAIEDQVIMVLGGVGDENTIQPIIDTLTDGNEETLDGRSKRLNLVGNVALMNLTVDEVAGWGSPCQNTLRTCWLKWWLAHKASFKVDAIHFRNYSFYPGYGLYEQFNDVSLR